MSGPTPPEAPLDCRLCPRLVTYREANKAAEPDWFNAPAPSFGDPDAELLIAGLAPGRTGANRTGRPFTGDFAGDLLYATLAAYGFSQGQYDARPDDGLVLTGAMITNAVRCAPPENKPTGDEIKACNPFFQARLAALPRLKVILALGKIAHDAVLRSFQEKLSKHRFSHGAVHTLPNGLTLIDSYHCSRYNTQTGRLTPQMFGDVFGEIRKRLDRAA